MGSPWPRPDENHLRGSIGAESEAIMGFASFKVNHFFCESVLIPHIPSSV